MTPKGRDMRSGSGFRGLKKAAAAAALLAMSQGATADNILRRGYAGPSSPASADATAAAAAADAMARQASNQLGRALDAIRQYQAAQNSARAAAQAAPSTVPDGLALGALDVAPGATALGAAAASTCTASSPWCGADLATQASQNGRTAVTVTQEQQKAILTWNTFNVGQKTDLHFDQSKGGAGANTWIALNRVVDPNAAPSQILGSIKAEGQVYVINWNGIIFGAGSQVNVATLVASGLDIAGTTIDPLTQARNLQGSNQRFLNGLLSGAAPTFAADPLVGAGPVTVEAGATIGVGSYGQALLLGGQVQNGGSIVAPDGQVLLAAGSGLSLSPSAASDLRGYVPTLSGGGSVGNAGAISAPRGNIKMLGGAIQQDGLLTATTSGEANGSIDLGGGGSIVTFGQGSVTQILPDGSGKKLVGTSQFIPSSIRVNGEKIYALDGSTLYAPGGDVTLLAQMSADQIQAGVPDDSRVYVGTGARIDVSGLRNVAVAMEQNTIEAQLRANELADNPVLRDSALRGRTIYFDKRLGVTVANVSGYYDLVERDVTQLMTSGGSLILSGNEIVTRQGSVLDVSGGSLRYLDGSVRSTQLIDPAGKRVRIEDAVAGVPYVGIDGDFVVNHSRWGITETYASIFAGSSPRFERGYVEGASAGTLVVGSAPSDRARATPDQLTVDPNPTPAFRIFDGEVLASTVIGPKQREMPTGSTDPTRVWSERPRGATLTIDRGGDVTVADVGTQLAPDFRFDSALDTSKKYQFVVPARWFDGSTFTKVAIESGYTDDSYAGSPGTTNFAPGGHLYIGAGVVVDVGDGGSFSFAGKRAEIDGTLRAPGGSVSITTLDLPAGVPWASVVDADRPSTRVGATGVIDVAGRWSNDRLDSGPLRALNGGSVSLIGVDVSLEQGSLVDASGGGRLDRTGAKLTAGNGGSILIDVSRYYLPDPSQSDPFVGHLMLDGTLRGHALGTGGKLTIDTGYDIVVGDALPSNAGANPRLFAPRFFTQGGFSAFSLLGEQSVTVTQGTALAPSVETLVLPADPAGLPTGARLDDVLERQIRPEDQRGPMTLSLSTVPVRTVPLPTSTASGSLGQLLVETGASIVMGPGSTVQLHSSGPLFADGAIRAPGGTIDLKADDLGRRLNFPDARVLLGANAQLLAPGYEKSTPDGALVRRSVEAGGAIAISSPNDVQIDPSAVIDVSGTQGFADLASPVAVPSGQSRTQAEWVAGSAGMVAISAAGGVLAGTLRLSPGGDAAAGGSLAINGGNVGPVVVRQDVPAGFGVTPDTLTKPVMTQSLTVVADRVGASGADDLLLGALKANSTGFGNANAIEFDGSVTLQTRRSLTLVSPMIGTDLDPGALPPGKVELSSGYVQLEGGFSTAPPAALPADLRGDLTVTANLIDVTRSVWLGCSSVTCTVGGFGTSRFVSSGDIRLADHDWQGNATSGPGLVSHGDLAFDSAQLYVASRLEDPSLPSLERAAGDPGFLVQSDGSIAVTGNGRSAPVPLSFGERLTLKAPSIVQAGVVRVPQGQIRLEGTGPSGSVALLPGSLTSASLEGLTVPFGAVAAGGEFHGYDIPGQTPTKSVAIGAPTVAVQPGAVIDVSGGGDLLGHLFVPGNGGSRDILSSSSGFAVLPSLGAGPAPLGGTDALRDPRLACSGSTRCGVGDSVWLQGVPGLANGYYTLLPAHYALLPGGLLVQPLGGSFASPPATIVRPDGAVIASGYLAVHGTTILDPGYDRFLVMSRDAFGEYSDFASYSFDDYARGLAGGAGLVARTPYDAGTAALSAHSLVLQGTGRFGAGQGGLLGNLDVSAPKIAVVGSGGGPPDSSYLGLDVQALEAFGAGSVLLGGTRAPAANGTAVTVNATDVVVNTGAASPWTGPEIILAATSSVTIADGSAILARGTASRDTNPLLLGGDGALLRLSTGTRVGIVRTGAAGSAGTLNVGYVSNVGNTGTATLSADGALTLDGSSAIGLSPDATLSGRQFDLASVRVNLGGAPPGAPGTTLGAGTIAQLASSTDLLIRGFDSIHVYGGLILGSRDLAGAATLQKITLDTGLLQGEAGAGAAATITAGQLALRNSGGGPLSTAAGGAGSLSLDVDALVLGPGQVQVAGYGVLKGRAGTIEAQGSGGLHLVGGGVSLATSLAQADAGASYALGIDGNAALALDPTAGAATPTTGLGGRLAIAAATVVIDTRIVLPAGTFEATATNGGLSLGSNARIDVSGGAVDFQDQVRFAPGGAIRLAASGLVGDLTIADGAVLDVSGSARGGDAGSIQLAAGRLLSVASGAVLRGAAAAGQGGAFALDAGAVGTGTADLSALNAKLEGGGFDTSREIRLRQQDIVLGTSDTVHAHEVVLRSDAGQVSVAGAIDAAGTAARPDGGIIQLVGGNGVVIQGTLDARAGQAPAGGFDPASGRVEVVATGGAVDVASEAIIDVTGGRSGGGSVVVRAPRVGSDVAVEELAGEFRGAREMVIQGVQGYQPNVVNGTYVVDGPLVAKILGEASSWLQSATGAIQARLAGWQIAPGMVVTSSGDLSIQSDIDLSTGLNGTGGPGFLGFVAPSGRIDVKATISDGFASIARDAALSSGHSFSYGFESGGDITLQPFLRTTAAGTIADSAMVRTGTGDIAIWAGRDLVLQDPGVDPTLAAAPPPVVYTAGRKTAWAIGFDGAPRDQLGNPMPVGEFPTAGGDVDIRAGRDIVAPFPAQTTSAWLFRYGDTSWNGDATSSTVKQQASWSIVYQNFEQGVGALGGGDVRVSAGRDIVQLQVSIPTTGQLTTAPGAVAQEADLVVRGGGDLELAAGGDILGGLFMLGRGHANLRAGGNVVASGKQIGLRTTADSGQTLGLQSTVGALFGLMDATARVTAGSAVDIEGAFDPMKQGQIGQNLVNGTSGSAFRGYQDGTTLEATSLGGSVTYENDPWASVDLSHYGAPAYQVTMTGGGAVSLNGLFSAAPPTLRLASLESSVLLKGRFPSTLTLAPAAQGTLEVLAREDVRISLGTQMLDGLPDYLRGPLDAFSTTGDNGNVGVDSILVPKSIHAGDQAPARIYALDGSVCAYLSGACVPDARSLPTPIILPKPLEVFAGKDVMAGSYQVRNDGANDLSWIRAGRDVYEVAFQVTGEGAALLEAGRNVVQNQYSSPAKGGAMRSVGDANGKAADLYVLAGTANGVNYDAFAAAYLDPANGRNVARTYLPELAAYMKGLGYPSMSDADLVAAFGVLALPRREVFLDRVYFTELKDTGIDYNDPTSPRFHSYARGFRAVLFLFPTDPSTLTADQRGSVILNAKPVETQAQGDITILAPYGQVEVGAEIVPKSVDPALGGVVTRRGGDIRIMADQDIDLFTSRVFTLQGGDITMWTSNGSITAGSGAKTSVFNVPLRYTMSPDGVVSVDVLGLQTGAGIGVLDALQNAEDRPRSRIDLIAPHGEVNAGDAGIRVVGDLNIAAQVVVGLENIQVSGTSSGVPKVEAPNIAALTTASQLAQAASKEGVGPEAQAKTTVEDLPSIITVEVVGYETTAKGEPSSDGTRPGGSESGPVGAEPSTEADDANDARKKGRPRSK